MMDRHKCRELASGRTLARARWRLLIIALLAMVALFVPTSAHALAGDTAEGRAIDSTNGRFSFSAQGTGLADRANGTWKHTFTSADPNRRVSGIVTCLFIGARVATIGGRITSDSFGALENQGFILVVEDEAKPGDRADDYLIVQLCGTPPPVCPDNFVGVEANILDGDIAVVPGIP